MRETFQRRLRHADAFADARPPMRFGGFRRFRGVKGVYDLRDETQPLVMGSQHEFAVGQPSQVWDGTTVGGAHRGESVNGAMTTFASNFHCHPLPHVEVAVAVHIGIGVAIGANHPALKVNVSFAVFADKVLLNAHSLGVAVAALAHLGQAELLSVVRARQKGVDEGMGVAPTSLCSRQRLPMRRFAFAVVGVGHVASGTTTGTKRSLLRLRRIGLDVALDAIAQEGAGKGRRLQRPKMAQLVDRSRRRCWLSEVIAQLGEGKSFAESVDAVEAKWRETDGLAQTAAWLYELAYLLAKLRRTPEGFVRDMERWAWAMMQSEDNERQRERWKSTAVQALAVLLESAPEGQEKLLAKLRQRLGWEIALQIAMRGWIVLHATAALIAFLLMVAHIVTAFYW